MTSIFVVDGRANNISRAIPRREHAASDRLAIGAAETGRDGLLPRPEGLYHRRFKRWIDLLFTALVFVPVSLLVLLIAGLVALDGGRPFYAQRRVGLAGRSFTMYKIRTMVPDADAVLERHLARNPADRIEWDHHQKLRNDPRITRIGRLLRRSSLDELPQFFNVLRGEMALVGPRPFLPEQQAYYPGTEYYAMRPGITGFWQTSVRNEASFVQRAAYDRSYYHALSPMTDLRVIGRTLRVVLRGTGL
ncbi:sugar transferase [Limimaricola cinnabarinus]|jgi:lipopolysaccharide/colanic/teichoic acid biosynthesis glycosyltransferase|uniref:Sugar transferase n=1 Tax=Limimaricola cinnabarinus TaxID=1125964 RepID=A0A2G1MG96_9RHOB|nr:sugar transferase [Limimaricola cinnabarinus]PHP27766.1 sugar transferase [Limimaricola cinnabarinus]